MMAGGLGVFLCTACCVDPNGIDREPPAAPPDDVPMEVVIARVNANSLEMDFLVRAGGVRARGQYLRGDRSETFELNGTLLFRRPRRVYLQLSHPLGTIEAGSDGQQVWFLGPDEWMPRHSPDDLPFRPDRLADVLGLGLLPINTRGSLGPVMRVGPETYELLFLDRDAMGQLYITHAVHVDRAPPYLVVAVVFFAPEGHPVMKAELSDHRPITDSEVLAPRRIRMTWLPDRGWMEMTFANMKRFDRPAAEARFSPREGSVVWQTAESDDDPSVLWDLDTAEPADHPSADRVPDGS